MSWALAVPLSILSSTCGAPSCLFAVGDAGSHHSRLDNVFAAPKVTNTSCITARRLYLSRAENNRLAHAETGNTANYVCARRSGRDAYLSNKCRNRLAHAENGNTSTWNSPASKKNRVRCCYAFTSSQQGCVDANCEAGPQCRDKTPSEPSAGYQWSVD